jgi:hypothetical protein
MTMEDIRKRSIARIKRDGLIPNDALPLLDRTNFKSIDSIWRRIVILSCFKTMVQCPEDRKDIHAWMLRKELVRDLSVRESTTFDRSSLNPQDEIDFSWYQESLYAMLWAVGIVKVMEYPSKESNVSIYLKFVPPDINIKDFVENIRLRNELEVFQELDYYYNLHWIGKRNVNGLNMSVILERRKALEWIVDENADWDDIDLST